VALAKVNGYDLISGSVLMPQQGAWSADLVVDAPNPGVVLGGVGIDLGGQVALKGTTTSAGSLAGRVSLRVVGGAGKLNAILKPKGYRAIPLRNPLQDLMADSGETLSGAVNPGVLATILARWTRFLESTAQGLDDLADRAGATWRVLYDGTVWMGTDSYPAVNVAADLLSGDPHLGRVELGVETPQLVPGVSFLGRNVSQVQHVISEGSIRTVVTFA